MENNMVIPQKLKMVKNFHFRIYNHKELKTGSQRDSHIAMARAVLFTMAKMWMQPKWPSADECIRKF